MLADAARQVISGKEAATKFWEDNLARAEQIDDIGFEVV